MYKVDFTSEFLPDLSLQYMEGVFSWFDLAAGKFPEKTEMLVSGTLGNEYHAIPFDKSAHHGNGIACWHIDFSDASRQAWQGRPRTKKDMSCPRT